MADRAETRRAQERASELADLLDGSAHNGGKPIAGVHENLLLAAYLLRTLAVRVTQLEEENEALRFERSRMYGCWDRLQALESVAQKLCGRVEARKFALPDPISDAAAEVRAVLAGAGTGEGERRCMMCGRPANVSVCDRCCE